MDIKTIELDGQKYTLDNPVDLLLSWALDAAVDEFRSKESLDRIATVLRAVCPSIPDRYFFPMGAYTIPLVDSYHIMDFVAKLLINVTHRRIKVIESTPKEDLKNVDIDVEKRVEQFRQAVDKMGTEFLKVKFNLILGGIQIKIDDENDDKPSENPIIESVYIPSPSYTEPRIMLLKQQLETLNSEILSLEEKV